MHAVQRCLEIIKEGTRVAALSLTGFYIYLTGGCEVDKAYTGPKLPSEDGKYSITLEFLREMMQWFKDGKMLPKRYVWEIVLGAYQQFEKEASLVDLTLEKGKSVDVIGDVHGRSSQPLLFVTHSSLRRTIL